MIGARAFAARRMTHLLLAALLSMASLCPMAWADAATADGATFSVADMERLMHQIEDPRQRDQLLKTLQALIQVAKQPHGDVPSEEKPGLVAEQSQGLFFAFGELTQYLGMLGRQLGQGFAAIPTRLAELPVLLRNPETIWFLMAIVLSALFLVIVGIMLQRLMQQLDAKLHTRAAVGEPRLQWRKAWLALMTVSLAVIPYIALLFLSGVVFSILPVGAMASGLAALVISTCLLYRLLHAIARVLIEPHAASARLLPINDNAAQLVWVWVVRLITLLVLYFGTTHALRTIGLAGELSQMLRGLILVVCASLLSVLIWRLTTQIQRPTAAAPENHSRRLWSTASGTLQKIWPIVATAYIWCVTLMALFSSRHGMTFLVGATLQMAMVIGVSIALLWGGELLFQHAAALNDRVGHYLPGLEKRTLRYLKMIWWSIRMFIALASLLLLLQVWDVDIVRFFTSPLGTNLLWRLVTLLLTVGMVMAVIDLSTFMSQKLTESPADGVDLSKKRRTLVPLTATVIKYSALFAGILIALHAVGVNVTPILAGVGILSLAVGFGAQTLVKDIINGLFILVEDSLAIGDVVNLRGTGGVVEAVNLRTIWLRDLQGSVHIIPNSQVETITNLTKDYAQYVLEVSVAYGEDTDEVIATLQEIDAEMRGDPALAADMLAPIEILGVDRFTDSAVVIAARLKTKPIKQWSVGREFNRRMKKLFDARGIEMPFPHRTLYWGDPKRGEAAPMHLQIQNLEMLTATQEHHQTAPRHQSKTEAS
jgi:moderate conductance mechanosensitive channel